MKKSKISFVSVALCLLMASPAFSQDGALPTEAVDAVQAAPMGDTSSEAAAEAAPPVHKSRAGKKKKHAKHSKKNKKARHAKKKKKARRKTA